MGRKAARSRHPHSLAHRTRPPRKSPGRDVLGNGYERVSDRAQVLDIPPPDFVRHRPRVDGHRYARRLRRSGQRLFGWSFAVVSATPTARGATREFLRFAAACWIVAAVASASLALLPSRGVALGGTATVLLVAALVSWILGDDDVRVQGRIHTPPQVVCAALLACIGAMGLALLLWLLGTPLARLTGRLFGLDGFIAYCLLLVAVVAFGVPAVLAGLVAVVRSFRWSRSDLLVFPCLPLLLLLFVTLTRLSRP